jgi:hypothetical protein
MKILVTAVLGIALMASPALAQESKPPSYSLLDTIGQSMFGDVYSDPSKWQPLSVRGFFTEGWNRPWVSPPAGAGGAPRQGWLNAFDGVFYRLGVLTGGVADNFLDNGNRYTGGLTFYAPFSARFEARLDIPFINSNRAGADNDYHTHFGDIQITPRVLISETQDFTQSFNVTFRIPSGSADNVAGFAAATPTWEFWWDPWDKLVLRGGLGFALPYTASDRTRNLFITNLAAGYYFTPHNFTPLGDLVTYLSMNLAEPIDDRGPHNTLVTLTPGIRTHLGLNWYLLAGVEVPVTSPKPFDWQALFGLMKVY